MCTCVINVCKDLGDGRGGGLTQRWGKYGERGMKERKRGFKFKKER